MLKVVVLGFGFMEKTHTGNLLKNPDACVIAAHTSQHVETPQNRKFKITNRVRHVGIYITAGRRLFTF